MNATETALLEFCFSRLLVASEEQFEDLNAGAPNNPILTDFNVGTIFTFHGVHYLVPNPPTATREEFHALRSAWQQESSTEG